MKDMKEIFLQRLQVGGVWLRASTVFLSFNDLDRMLAKKCTKGSNLLRYLKKKALVSVLFQSRRFGIFLYQLLERLFYVSCVRVGPESCIFTARLWKRSAIFRDKGRFENLIFLNFWLRHHNISGHIRTPFPWMEVVNVWFCRETVKLNLNYGCDKSATSFGRELPIPLYGWGQVSIIFPFS